MTCDLVCGVSPLLAQSEQERLTGLAQSLHLPGDRPGRLHQAEVELEVGVSVLVQQPTEVLQVGAGELDDDPHLGPVLESDGHQRRLPVLHLHVSPPDSHLGHELELRPHLLPLQLLLVYLAALEIS